MARTRMDESQRRSEATATKARRRDRSAVLGQRLGINEDKLDTDKFDYRWIKDETMRFYQMTKKDDWDVVRQDGSEVKDDAELDSAVFHISGTHADGSVLRLYLCRKPIALVIIDRQEKMAQLERELEELTRGNDRSGAPLADYVPNEGIRI